MRGSNDINLMMASLMPAPDGILLLATLDGVPGRPLPESCEPEMDAPAIAMLVSAATLVIGLLALLPAPI